MGVPGCYFWVALHNANHPEKYNDSTFHFLFFTLLALVVIIGIVGYKKAKTAES